MRLVFFNENCTCNTVGKYYQTARDFIFFFFSFSFSFFLFGVHLQKGSLKASHKLNPGL